MGWSGCSSRIDCQAQQSRNFEFGSNLIRNQCKAATINNARNYSPSLCTMCAKLGDAGVPNSLLFGADATTLHVSSTPPVSITFAALETDPTQIMISLLQTTGIKRLTSLKHVLTLLCYLNKL